MTSATVHIAPGITGLSQEEFKELIAFKSGHDFNWGDIRAIHLVGHYMIVEHDANQPSNIPDEEWEPSVSFYLYVSGPEQGEDEYSATSRGFGSLDEALIAGVIYRNEWVNVGRNAAANEHLSDYLARILDL